MAIQLNNKVESKFKVIASIDNCLDVTAPDFDKKYADYIRTNDESFLPFIEGEHPTYFILRNNLTMHAYESIMQKQISIGEDMKPQVNISYTLEEIRCALVDIENPKNVPDEQKIIYKKDTDGFTSKELIAQLHEAGIVNNLFSARQALLQNNPIVSKKK